MPCRQTTACWFFARIGRTRIRREADLRDLDSSESRRSVYLSTVTSRLTVAPSPLGRLSRRSRRQDLFGRSHCDALLEA